MDLASARRELLDLGLRNPLLNHRLSKARGVRIVDELPAEVWRLLWHDEAALTFTPAAAGAAEDEQAAPAEAPPLPAEPAERHRDRKLQTAHAAEALQTRLLATHRDARLSVEETGVSTLHLALGFLRWREPDAPAGEPLRSAPLWLVPVRLERTDGAARFQLVLGDDDPGWNLSLAAKLAADFGLRLPEPPGPDDLDLAAWFAAVAQAVAGQAGWQVEPRLQLDFFSFGRFLMYRDLDPEAWPADRAPAQQPLLAAVLGGGFREPAGAEGEVDARRQPGVAHEVLDSDSSQTQVLLDVAAGRNLVVQGPPGTGKSQTIANLIAEAVGRGQTVLFVAEKLAALTVVQRRLAALGLGPLALELHSGKASRRAVAEELRRTLAAGRPVPPAGGDPATELAALRQRLAAYARELHLPLGDSGSSPAQAMAVVMGLPSDLPAPAAQPPALDAARWSEALAAAGDCAEACRRLGGWPAHPWADCGLLQLGPAEEARLPELLRAASAALPPLAEAAAALSSALGLAPAASPAALAGQAALAAHWAACPDPALDPARPEWSDPALDALLAEVEACAAQRARWPTLRPAAWEADLAAVRADVVAYGGSLFSFLSGAWRRAKAQLTALVDGPLPGRQEDLLALCDAVAAHRVAAGRLAERDGLGRALFGGAWRGAAGDPRTLRAARDWVRSMPAGGPGRPTAALAAARAQADAALAAWRSARDPLLAALAWDARHPPDGLPLADLPVRLAALAADPGRAQEVLAVNRAAARLAALGLGDLVELARRTPGAGERLPEAATRWRARSLVDRAWAERPALAVFDRDEHERLLARFAQLDRAQLAWNRWRLADQHWRRLPGPGGAGQAGLLRREAEKKARHLPIRQLLVQAGAAVQRVKPVFLMSPLSVAAHLDPQGPGFDLVVFDEASQVRPVDAFGSLLRARRAVVVGDSKQMPPTSFFDRLVAGSDDGEEQASDLESLLGLMLGAGCPSRMLSWHYRSRHPALIAVSNREFYEGRLLTFPSPAAGGDAQGDGLHYRKVDGVYDRARTRANALEAQAVAEAVLAHAERTPGLSLGVAAFSQAQMECVALAVERLRRTSPALEKFLAAHANEPFFVKNLENVQGDERDAILVSVGYGRDAQGQIALQFGPLNLDGGERRLNVLITRARRRCVVFTNLAPEDIDPARSPARGVQALRTFLAYARDGRLPGASPAAAVAEGAPSAAARALGERAQAVGEGGVALRAGDLALLADGADWAGLPATRDRDRLRPEVLAGLGWRLHRLWTPAWFRRAAAEADRLRAAATAPASAPAPAPAAPARDERTLPPGLPPIPVLAAARPRLACERRELPGLPPAKLAAAIAEVVAAEGPVHRECAVARLLAAAPGRGEPLGLLEAVERAIAVAGQAGQLRNVGVFLWPAGAAPALPRDRSALDHDDRRAALVAPEEIQAALLRAVEEACGLAAEEAPKAAARILGLLRGEEGDAAWKVALDGLVAGGRLRGTMGGLVLG